MNQQAMRRADAEGMGRSQPRQVQKTATPGQLDTEVLFAGGSEVVIAHGAEVYRLRLTRQNKLILTK
jgi:hemin uptake protein HemP